MTDSSKLVLIQKIVDFILGIGLEITRAELRQKTFLPGVSVDSGVIIIDEAKLLYPGDLLHEAGHLAVITPKKRNQVQIDVGNKAAEEMMAIAWSYAALVHLELQPSIVFHEGGYRGGSENLIENFTNERYIGVPMLEWLGMTVGKKRAAEIGVKPYPQMIKWMLE